MRVLAYTRVSTADQAAEGESLATQKQRIAGYAAGQGWEIDHTYTERGVSGSRPLADRPMGRALLADAREGDVVIATKLDRAFRSASDALAALDGFKRRGVRLVLLDMGEITDNGVGALIFRILASVAEFERERIAERTAETKAALREQGRAVGPAPWGYTTDGDGYLHPDPATYPGREQAEAMARDGQSARAIHRALVAAGYRVSLPTVSKIAKAARKAAA